MNLNDNSTVCFPIKNRCVRKCFYRLSIVFLGTLFCVALLCVTPKVIAANLQDEISHLINYVRTTDCHYERNGTKHDGKEAAEHIQDKYDYFEDDISTTEDFIAYAATKSLLSGEYYLIHCTGKSVVKSHLWLQEELMRYRQAGTDS